MGGVCPWGSSALCPFAVLAQSLVQGEAEEGGSVPLLLVPISVGQRRAGSEAGAAAEGMQAQNTGLKSCL